ncbi:MAG: EamA family transporter [Clostridium sp.]|jgi:drug/metabolite transporter (DMT)-like permease|nr:EamA family transporter [Clostridium sp.]
MHSSKASRKKTRGIIFTLAGGTLWGFSGTCGQYLFSFEEVDPGWLTVTRMLWAGVILLAFSFASHRDSMKGILKDRKDRLRLIIFAVLGLTSCQYTYLAAISYSNAGTATVLQYLGPALVMLVSCFLSKRLPSRKELFAAVLAISGTFLLATHGNPGSLAISPETLFWGLSSAVALMLYTMLPASIIPKWGSTVVTGYGMLIGGIFLFFTTGYWNYHVNFNLPLFLGSAAIILIGTALAFTLYLQGVSDIGSVKASMLACIEPVSATVISAAWLKTSFSPADIIGLSLIVITVLLLSKKDDTKLKSLPE